MKKKLKKICRKIIDKILIKKKKYHEIKKYNDKRRKKIYKKVFLTSKQKKEINNYYKLYYGRKIPLVWHRHNLAFSGNYDYKIFPELLYISEFEYYMNNNVFANNFIEDKNNLKLYANYLDVKIPKTIVSCQCGIIMNEKNEVVSLKDTLKILNDIGVVFFKPTVDSDSGKGCKLFNFKNGKDLLSGEEVKSILINAGNDFVFQEKITCHDDLKKIYPNSVNTFRVITYRFENKIYHMPVIMRIGRNGAFLDNAHAGGIFIGLKDDGSFLDKAFTEFNDVFYEHPDTKYVFKKQKIKSLPKIIEKCQSMHDKIRNIGVINWDVTLNEKNEIVVIEVNVNNGSIWLPQFAHGKGAFGELTPSILKWLKEKKSNKKL